MTVSGSALHKGNLHVCLPRLDTIYVACHNGIVHSHQLYSVENAFTCVFKDFCWLEIRAAFISDSDIQLLLSSWLVKYLAGFGQFSSNC